MLKSPEFWQSNSIPSKTLSFLVLPFSWLFLVCSFIKIMLSPKLTIENKFVICIGNVSLGGTGKTPTAIAFAEALKANGYSVCFLSRGYRRKTKGFIKVSHDMDAKYTGDEPQLLSRHAQVYLYSSVYDIIQNAASIKENIVIMDDGLQNTKISKNFAVLVVDQRLFGNEKVFPAGPLRESIVRAKSKVDYILYTGEQFQYCTKKKVYRSTSKFYLPISPQKVTAFSGIGNNQKFLQTLNNHNFDVIKFFDFPDHHYYSNKEVEQIINFAQTHGVKILTTEKDFIKIDKKYRSAINTIKMEIILPVQAIDDVISAIRKKKSI